MNKEGEINEDDKMAKHTIFSCLSAHTIKTKGERKRDMRVSTQEEPSQNGYKKQMTRCCPPDFILQ